jgi:hypothetical protein
LAVTLGGVTDGEGDAVEVGEADRPPAAAAGAAVARPAFATPACCEAAGRVASAGDGGCPAPE